MDLLLETLRRHRSGLQVIAAALASAAFVVVCATAPAVPAAHAAAGSAASRAHGATLASAPGGAAATSRWPAIPPPRPGSGHAAAGKPGAAASPVYYEYSTGYAANNGVGATSGSVQISVQHEGVRQPDGTYGTDGQNHSLGEIEIFGSGSWLRASLEIGITPSAPYCKAESVPCFYAFTWLNGQETFTQGYVETSGGIPDDGSYHPALGSTVTVGWSFTSGRVNVLYGGKIVGYVPTSFWGSDGFGPISDISVYSEVYNSSGVWTGGPIPSMNWTFSNYTDSLGDTLGTPAVSTPYTLSNISSGGWTVSGGNSPDTAGTYWEVQADDNGDCLDDTGDSTTNGNPIQIWACNGDNAQAWRYNPANGELVNENGDCLDDTGHSQSNGTKVQIWKCLGDASQDWSEVTVGNDFTEYKNGSVCLDNTGDTTTDGTKVQVWSCLGDNAQSWDAPF